MSIKGFHIVFVTISTLLCVFLAVWSLFFAPETSSMVTTTAAVGLIGSLALPCYGIYFYRKITRNQKLTTPDIN